VVSSVTERGVLVIGRYGSDGLEVSQSIATELRERKYIPIIFDFDRPADRDYTETVQTLASLSRFVILDLSGVSVPQELYATIPKIKIPYIPIIERGKDTYSSFSSLLEYPWVIAPPVEFESKEHLIELMPSKIIAPAEEKHRERQKLLEQLFNR
jgi:Mlc titration factor MtfA (ptsG expression regulator)